MIAVELTKCADVDLAERENRAEILEEIESLSGLAFTIKQVEVGRMLAARCLILVSVQGLSLRDVLEVPASRPFRTGGRVFLSQRESPPLLHEQHTSGPGAGTCTPGHQWSGHHRPDGAAAACSEGGYPQGRRSGAI